MKNSPIKLTVPLETGVTTALVYPAEGGTIGAALILGHGAGAGRQSGFMVGFAGALSALGVDVVTFNFPYTEQRRHIPDRAPVLESCFRSVMAAVRRDVASARDALFIGGKSMGGRIATQVASGDTDLAIAGLVLLGYPLHPPGKPDQRRDKHLASIGRPMLCIQGSRDAFGTPAELAPVLDALSPRPLLHVVEGGDHSLKVARRNAAAQGEIFADVQRTIVSWMSVLLRDRVEKR